MKRPLLKTWACLSAVLLIGGSVTGSDVARTGVAHSAGTYSIERGESILPHTGSDVAEVREGDVIVTKQRPLNLKTAGGDALLIGDNSRIEVASADALNVGTGKIAVSFAKNSALRPTLSGLQIVPLANAGAEAPQSIVLAAVLESGEVVVKSVSNAFAVRQAGSTTASGSIATVGAGDTMTFATTAAGTWLPVAQMPVTGDEVIQRGALSEDAERQIFPLWWGGGAAGTALLIGGGALVATGATVGIIEVLDDDSSSGDDDDDDFFPPPPFSPIGPSDDQGGDPDNNSTNRFF